MGLLSGCLSGSALKNRCDDAHPCRSSEVCSALGVCEAPQDPLPPVALLAPSGLTASVQDRRVHLQWEASLGARTYNVLRREGQQSHFFQVASVPGTSFDDAVAWNQCTSYTYVVSAAVGETFSAPSNQASASPHSVLACWETLRAVPHWRHVASRGAETMVVGDAGQFRTSLDAGASWGTIAATDHLPKTIGALLARPTRFLAFGADQVSSSSTDTWLELATIDAGFVVTAVAASADRIVAVDEHGRTAVSFDEGATWSVHSTTAAALTGVAYGNGGFVALSGDGLILTSSDGSHWVLGSATPGAGWLQAQAAASGFIALRGDGEIQQSPDGLVWSTTRAKGAPLLTALASLVFGDLALGPAGRIALAPAWTVGNVGLSNDLHAATWTGSRAVIVGEANTVLTSLDGNAWAPTTFDSRLSALAGDANRAIAVGSAGMVLRSNDQGSTWQPQLLASEVTLRTATMHGTIAVAAGDHGALFTSRGETFTAVVSPTGADFTAAASNGLVVLVVGTQNTILSSLDSDTWEVRQTGGNETSCGVVFGNGHWVVVSKEGQAQTSNTGATWSVPTPIASHRAVSGLAFAQGQFITGTTQGTVLLSSDGVAWSSQALGVTDDVTTVGSWQGRFVALTQNTLHVSVDGKAWEQVRITPSPMAKGNWAFADIGQAYMVGPDGTILTKR